jgi:hypothetical protein
MGDRLSYLVRQRIHLSNQGTSDAPLGLPDDIDRKIDELVYEIYGLNPQDIANLEEADEASVSVPIPCPLV